MKKTLLELATEVKHKNRPKTREYGEEDLDLALAWIDSKVSATQICKTLKKSGMSGNYLYYISIVLRKFYREGKIKIKKLKS